MSWFKSFSKSAMRTTYALQGHVEDAEQRVSERIDRLEQRVAELERGSRP